MADEANGILRNAIIALPLKYLSNVWISLEIPLINCKVELKFKWTKYCVLSVCCVFSIKETKLYVSVVTLSARHNQKLSKLLSKGFERIGINIKRKVIIKMQQMSLHIFSNQIFLE